MADDDLQQEIESTREEIQAKRERLEKLERKASEQTAEDVELEDFEAMSAQERKELRQQSPERWRRLLEEKRDRALKRLEDTPGGGAF